ncbi:MAG: hypothetical protein Q9185_003023 [Variospora sp. 1 TL-2023]
MSIEAGARAGIIAPNEITFKYLEGRPLAPKLDSPEWKKAVKYWSSLKSDAGAAYDEEVFINARDIAPTVSWGTSPQDVVPITGVIPDPESFHGEAKKESGRQALMYMGLRPGTRMEEIELDKVFIVPNLKRAMIVPGSGLVKKQAEAEGLDRIFQEAGFEWREVGCSMCLGMNPDILAPGERCASTSNRNFEGRQGAGGRTHLMSPVMAAAAAIVGKLADVRKLADQDTTPAKVSLRVDVTPEVSEIDTDDDLDRILDLPSEPQTQNRDGGASASGGQTKFTVLKGITATIERSNINTDAIIPKQFLKTIKRTGLSSALFHSLQYREDSSKKAELILNRDPYHHAQILVITGPNFSYSSSQEHTPTAFPVAIPNQPTLERIAGEARAGHEIEVNLIHQRINDTSGGKLADFEVKEFWKHSLVNNLDNIGLTMQMNDQIKTFEDRRTLDTPWLDGSGYLKRRDRKGPIHVETAPVPKTNQGEDIEEPLEW